MFSSPAVRPGTREVTVPLGVVCFADVENMRWHALCDYVFLYGEVCSNHC